MKIYVAKIFEYLPDGSYYPSEYEKYFVFKEAAEEYVAKAIAKGAEKNSLVEEIEVEEWITPLFFLLINACLLTVKFGKTLSTALGGGLNI